MHTSKQILLIVACICFYSIASYGQLSPGKLTKEHSSLEGMANCTQCHTIGEKISEQKCLSCHKELNTRITANKGYHTSLLVKGKECISCHSEHHGLNFDMIRFDKKTFNHNLTGYELKGAHKTVDCASCHKSDNMVVSSLKKNKTTYLGLDVKCLSCHEDQHQATLSQNCTACHGMDKFKPASQFSHNKTDFPLLGVHKTVDCVSCHKETTKNGKPFTQYAGVNHSSCTNCHKDQHNGAFGQNCKACHNEESFQNVKPSKNFNHSQTGFTLVGRHSEIDCKKCHDGRNSANSSFGEFKKIIAISCTTCHQDAHEGKFGNDCKSCHNQNNWRIGDTKNLANFDHNKTNFELKGKHNTVDCRKCHVSEFTTPIVHDKCISCHKDYHEGDFTAKVNKYPDCTSCHTESGFTPSLFTLEAHTQSDFTLNGAHIATPCFSCHWKENKWKFKEIGKSCTDCHKNIHEGNISDKYYLEKSCTTCHSTDTWRDVTFDHNLTSFHLEGKHTAVSCAKCHIDKSTGSLVQQFKGKSMACESCHNNIHGNQFAINGTTDCIRCHGFESWGQKHFNHDNTNFPLTGEHIKVECKKCHKETVVNGKTSTLYKIEKHECIDCHQ